MAASRSLGRRSERSEASMPRAGDRLSRGATGERTSTSVPPPLGLDEALAEANRCLYCFDAPCTRACPTGIDVPKFIRQILHRDEVGAARTILDANIFGGSCARACPTEVLCEGACVDLALMQVPDPDRPTPASCLRHRLEPGRPLLRARAAHRPTGRDHRLRPRRPEPVPTSCGSSGTRSSSSRPDPSPAGSIPWGSPPTRSRPSSPWPRSTRFCEIGIDLRLDHRIEGGDLPGLLAEFDAVFLAIGLGKTAPLGIEGEGLPGVWEALDFISQMHEKPFEDCEVGRQVLVLGAGNTAIDAATAAVAARGRVGDDRLSPGGVGLARVRLRVWPGQGRRGPLRVARPAPPRPGPRGPGRRRRVRPGRAGRGASRRGPPDPRLRVRDRGRHDHQGPRPGPSARPPRRLARPGA